MKEIDKLAWLHIDKFQLLGARSKNKDIYYIPGGKREPGESDHEALIREIKEELSIVLLPQTIQYAGTFSAQADAKPEGTIVKMSCYFAAFTGDIKPDAEIETVRWLQFENKPECSLVTQKIMDWLKAEKKII